MHLPILRWGKPYDSLEKDKVVHFITGETIAEVSQANGALMRVSPRMTDRSLLFARIARLPMEKGST